MSVNREPCAAREIASESVENLELRIRSLIAGEKISTAREWAEAAVRLHPDRTELKLLRDALHPGRVTLRQLPDSSHRRNMAWLSRHHLEFRGKWVALLDGQLVAADADLQVVLAALPPLGSAGRPLIHHIRD